MSIPKRTYNASTRQAQAQQTKERILACAKKIFQEKGFEFATIEDLAKAAKVSGPTVYGLFKSKRGILHALLDQAFPANEHESLVQQAKQAQSPEKRLAIAAKIARQMYEAEKQQIDMLRGAIILAPEFKKIEQKLEQRRYKRLEDAIHTLAKEKCLNKALNITKAHDILWAFTGRDMYRLFVAERNWSPEDYELWLTQLLIKTLLNSDDNNLMQPLPC